jgi:hypothetical protein
VVYVYYCEEFLGPNDVPQKARERARDTFLTEEQLRRKQNAEALRQMGIIQ